MNATLDVVAAGHICLDILPRIDAEDGAGFAAQLRPGRLLEVGPATFAAGGAVANTGLALHRLGNATRLMALTGRDEFGDTLRRLVAACGPGLEAGLRTDPACSTSYSVIISPPGVDRMFLHCPGANAAFGIDDIDYELLAGARLFHFGYPPIMQRMFAGDGGEFAELLRRAKATGVTTSVDMAFPDPHSAGGRAAWRTILKRVLPYVDVFMPSCDEILYMLRPETYAALVQRTGGSAVPALCAELLSDVGRELLSLGARIVAIKLGDRGLHLRTAGRDALGRLGRTRLANPDAWADQELWAPCFEVEVAGATGAGDATIAGFLSALLRGLAPAAALTAAVAVGACCCEAADALSGIQSWAATQARIARGWPHRPLQVDAPGWRFDTQHGLWAGPAARA